MPYCPVHPTRPDTQDTHFVIGDVSSETTLFYLLLNITKNDLSAYIDYTYHTTNLDTTGFYCII